MLGDDRAQIFASRSTNHCSPHANNNDNKDMPIISRALEFLSIIHAFEIAASFCP